jgi:hypothetical protein
VANIKDRPYVGTWALEGRKLVQHTPDSLVYLQGSLTLPGCRSCDGRIDIQKFITEVSVESGVDPNGASASFTMSVPLHSTDAFARDAKFLLHPGLEVHVYTRGYFPVKGLYSNLAEPLSEGNVESALASKETARAQNTPASERPSGGSGAAYSTNQDDIDFNRVPTSLKSKWGKTAFDPTMGGDATRQKNAVIAMGAAETIERYWRTKYPNATVKITSHHRPGSDKGNHSEGAAVDFQVNYTDDSGQQRTVPALQAWGGLQQLIAAGRIPQGGSGLYLNAGPDGITGADPSQAGNGSRGGYPPGGSANTHYDFRGAYGFRTTGARGGSSWIWVDTDGDGKDEFQTGQRAAAYAALKGKGAGDVVDYYGKGGWANDDSLPTVGAGTPNLLQSLGQEPGGSAASNVNAAGKPVTGDDGGFLGPGDTRGTDVLDGASQDVLTNLRAKVSSSLLERFGLQGLGIEDVASYPYYHTFHGVVIQVGHSWSGGMQTITVQCASMLHFWQYHKINTQLSIAGAKVGNAGLDRSLKGHNFTNFHPYQIIHRLHQMTIGSQNAVGGAMSRASNLTAVDPGSGKTLQSMMTEYWNRRFNGRTVPLRMHGVSGELYSTLQAALLSRSTSENLSKKIQRHFATKGESQKLDAITGLNLGNDRKLRGRLFSQSSFGGRGAGRTKASRPPEYDEGNGGDNFALNILNVKAFHDAVANYHNYGVFEATYMSKLDIAQKVMEVTGFEFYQDVDGSLVFKPPMWNLDTSSSRVYRIEDIDIINLSFDEKEPQCTYTVVKSSQFAAKGTEAGVTGDYGKRAVYIDFRLVAQFGYRPFEFETTYLQDVQSMYYMGVARMDVLNVPINSASVTIPLRPEMRPGYPIYIPYLDCHYYVQSISHSFSVGGQCTTTMQLVGKRSKFYAPGRTDAEGIDSIDLSDGTLPQRPLEVQAGDGTPRLSGFPNVVMAMDPKQVNPMWYPSGASTTRMEKPQDFRDLLRLAGRAGLGLIGDQGDGVYTMDTIVGFDEANDPITKTVTFYFGDDVASKPAARQALQQAKQNPSGPIIEIKQAIAQYSTFKSGSAKTTDTVARAAALGAEAEAAVVALSQIADKTSVEHAKLLQKRDRLLKQQQLWVAAGNNPTEIAKVSDDASLGVKLIFQFMDLFQDKFWVGQDAQTAEEITTHHLAQLLWNRKANFSGDSGAVGAYRYYSASHPDPAEQGQDLVTFRSSGGGTDVIETPQMLDDEWADITVMGYVRTPDAIPGTFRSEAKFEDVRPQRGILVQTATGGTALGQVLPTSEILTVMFGTQLVEAERDFSSSIALRAAGGFGKTQKPISQFLSIKGVGKDPTTEDTASTYFAETWDELWGKVLRGVLAAGQRFKLHNPDGTMTAAVPVFDTSFPTQNVKSFGEQIDVKSKAAWKRELNSLVDRVGLQEALVFQRALSKGFVILSNRQDDALKAGTLTREAADVYTTALVDYIASALRLPLSVGGGSKQLYKGEHKTSTWSPVFPVSDAQGYSVVGSFQYGRGLDIEPGGVWDAIQAQDPLSVLDKKTVDNLISGLVRGQAVTVEVEKVLPGGQIVKEKREFQGKSARSALEKKALQTLRKNYSDQRLIDLGLLVASKKDPSLYEFNLMNWISSQKEGVHKLPVVNAAFSLADLSVQQDGKVCTCKAAEANIKIEAYGNEAFLTISQGGAQAPTGAGTGADDRVTEWLRQQGMAAGVPHKLQQDAMRGVALDRPTFGSLDELKTQFSDQIARITDNAASAEDRFQRFADEASAKANEKLTNVDTAFGGDEEG